MNIIQKIAKRTLDIVISAITLVVFSPLFLYCYIMVRKEDGGTAIFSQERIGLHGKPFFIYKFRSMKMNAEEDEPLLFSQKQIRKQFLNLRSFQYLAKGNHLIVDHDGRHRHYTIFHDLFHIGDILHLDTKAEIADSLLRILILLVAGLTACPQNLDAADTLNRLTAAARSGLFGTTATGRSFFHIGLSAATATRGNFLFFFLFSKIEQCHNDTSVK